MSRKSIFTASAVSFLAIALVGRAPGAPDGHREDPSSSAMGNGACTACGCSSFVLNYNSNGCGGCGHHYHSHRNIHTPPQ